MGSNTMESSRGRIHSIRWIALAFCVSSLLGVARAANADYSQALALSLEYFEAQRSGYLPSNSRVTWRFNSGLHDGLAQGIDLIGGYYDAGDNVKFGFPMAFTMTMLSWSVVAYQNELEQQGQFQYALDAIRWGTDYFIKAHPEPNVLWAEVGDGTSDHYCWERPEDMTTSRQAYSIDVNNPGSEVAAETAAAMAAASIAFSSADPSYSATLLSHAKELFTFADTYRGHYDDSIPCVKPFYPSGPSGYNDELLWASAWLFEATNDQTYLEYLVNNADALGGDEYPSLEFGWDIKDVGVQVLATKILLEGRGGEYTSTLQDYKTQADYFVCACLGQNDGTNIARSPGGMLFTQAWNNMQFVTAASFVVTYYSDLLSSKNGQLTCSGNVVQPSQLLNLGQSQADYILGNNPRGLSYMVGYSNYYPLQVHHRGASEPSIQVDSQQEQCLTGYAIWFSSPNPNPNVLTGAIVGGPDGNDNYVDARSNYEGGEACTYNNGGLVGLLARLAGGSPSTVSYAADTEMPTSYQAPTPLPSSPAPSPLPSSPAPTPLPSDPAKPPNASTDLLMTQRLHSSWNASPHEYYKYMCSLSNASNKTLEHVILTFEVLEGSVYGLTRMEDTTSFTFPSSLKTLMPGKSLDFVYISHHSTPTHISLDEIEFV